MVKIKDVNATSRRSKLHLNYGCGKYRRTRKLTECMLGQALTSTLHNRWWNRNHCNHGNGKYKEARQFKEVTRVQKLI